MTMTINHEDGASWAEEVGRVVDETLNQALDRHLDFITQEHQITSRIAGVLENRFKDYFIADRRVQVFVQELPDKGRRSLEKVVSADLYISVVIVDGNGISVSKGLLIQSKRLGTGSARRLASQVQSMLARTNECYIWTYQKSGIRVEHARSSFFEEPRSPGDLLKRALECTAGDFGIGIDVGKPAKEALRDRLEALRVPLGFMLQVTSQF